MIRWPRLPREHASRQAGVAGVLASALVVWLALAAFGQGYPGTRVVLSGGGAWLASASQGLMTLIDGASEQVMAVVRVPGAAKGDALSVVQSGPSAYVGNDRRGTVARVDGRDYKMSQTVRFGEDGQPLGVYAGPSALYIVDRGRGLASVTDTTTLRVRSTLALAARPGPGQAVVDETGRLWVVNGAGGGLTRFDAGGKNARSNVGDSVSQLVLVQGEPVLADLSHPRLGRLDADSGVRRWSCLEILPGERPRLLGSATSARVFAAVPSTGTLVVASLDSDDCSAAVVVGAQGDDFGPLVETGGFVFVPNRSTGQTTVVDVAARRVAVHLQVVKRSSRLELFAKDGFVFYNDLGGDEAGVIRFEGGHWKRGKSIKKYNPSDPGKGVLSPGQNDTAVEAPPLTTPPVGKPGVNPSPTAQFKPGEQRLPPAPDRSPLKPPSVRPGRPLGPPVIRDITWLPDPAVRGVPVTFRANADNVAGSAWRWTLTDTPGATLRSSTQVGGFTHTFNPGDPDLITVTLELTGPGGSATPMSKSVRTTSELVPQISGLTVAPAKPLVDEPVTISANEPVAGARGVWTWKGVNLDDASDTFGPAPGGAQQPLIHTFTNRGTHRLTLTVTYDGASNEKSIDITVEAMFRLTVNIVGNGSGTVTANGLMCNGRTCTGLYPAGQIVDPRAEAGAGSVFKRWDGCPEIGGGRCEVKLRLNVTVTATFDIKDHTPPPSPSLTGGGQTVGVGSGGRTVTLAGTSKTVDLTATATDPESAVTRTELWMSHSYTCLSADRELAKQVGPGLVGAPTRTADDGSLSYRLNVGDHARCRGDFPILSGATFDLWVEAVSGGGRSPKTDTLTVNYSE